jgi:uncharacterized zinc-type alcohol dehydrogenase-like protein
MSATAATVERQGYAALTRGAALTPFTYDLPSALPYGEVDVRVTHSSICHTDLHMIADDWGASTFPLVAGHEIVGVVAAAGEGVKGLKPGDRVGVGWLRDSCRRCRCCVKGMENLCEAQYTVRFYFAFFCVSVCLCFFP